MGTDGVTLRARRGALTCTSSPSDSEVRLLRKGPGTEAKLVLHRAYCEGKSQPIVCALRGASQCRRRQKRMERRGREPLGTAKPGIPAPKSAGADKVYHDEVFMSGCRDCVVAPHLAARMDRAHLEVSATLAQQASQKCSNRLEEICVRGKDNGVLPQAPWLRRRAHPCPRPRWGGSVISESHAKLMVMGPPKMAGA